MKIRFFFCFYPCPLLSLHYRLSPQPAERVEQPPNFTISTLTAKQHLLKPKPPPLQTSRSRASRKACLQGRRSGPSGIQKQFSDRRLQRRSLPGSRRRIKTCTRQTSRDERRYPRWLLRDPRAPHNPRTPLRVEKDEPLLAVIHGYGANAWRDPEATQTFLLKNVVGADMRVHDGKEFHQNQQRPQGATRTRRSDRRKTERQ